jgi:signal transduction histidine kinase/ActR/RegA family two-component response regulator
MTAVVGIAFVAFWLPRVKAQFLEFAEREVTRQVQITAEAIQPFLLQRQYAAVYETLVALQARYDNWNYVALERADGRRLYPLQKTDLPEGPNLIVASSAIVLRGEEFGTLVVAVDLTEETSRVGRESLSLIIVAGLMFMTAIVIFALAMDRLVTQRVRTLSRASGLLAKGDYSADLPKQIDDEIGELATNFAAMRETIQANERNLIKAHRAAEASGLAKAQFLATMSHEIRTPLNGVMPVAELLMGTTLTPEQERHVRTIRNSGRALSSIINDILDISRMEANEYILRSDVFQLQHLVRGVCDILKIQARNSGLSLSYEIADDAKGYYESDPDRIRQVLLNLAGNAVKFTEKGSVRILVDVSGTVDGKPNIRFRVVDTGIGIPLDQQSQIFDRFAQVDSKRNRKFGGSGLGLYISRAIVNALQGSMSVQSEPGSGSTFTFVIPLHPVTEEEARTRRRKADRPEFEALSEKIGRMRVLVADDNFVNLQVADAMLRKNGVTPVLVESGKQAVDAVSEGNIDLIFMDVQMPEMDGLEATRTIRNLRGPASAVRIVGLSASAFEEDTQACYDAGMDGFVAKPISSEALRESLALAAKRLAD